MSEPKPVVKGSRYNLLTVIEEVERHVQNNGRTRRVVKVSCDCGSIVDVMLENLYAGYSKSCGCVLKEKAFRHGLTGTNFKDVHTNMKARCDNPNHPQYKDYGGRGITYCHEWSTLKGFADEMYSTYEQGLTLDRENVDGGYSKSNCRWVSMTIQGHNKRKKVGTIYQYKGIRINNNNPDTLVAHINFKGVSYYLASFATELEAAKAYDDASEIFYNDRPNRTEPKEDFILELVKNKLRRKGVLV